LRDPDHPVDVGRVEADLDLHLGELGRVHTIPEIALRGDCDVCRD
jgi:hypothetical protein